jgi:hypothetical protein
VVTCASFACDDGPVRPDDGVPPPPDGLLPLNDLGTGLYLGRYEGGLYPDGSDELPDDHLAAGLERAVRIRPLDSEGRPDPDGKEVLLSIGMSNATQEFCGSLGNDCAEDTFIDQALADPRVDRVDLVIVNGAQGGRAAEEWDSPSDEAYDRVRENALEPLGLSEAQVQAVWLKEAHARPFVSLPSPAADALALERDLGEIVRALAERYPNVQLVFLSSRTYGGYATTDLNPEPYAYESGFAVKWLIEAQIRQEQGEGADPVAGDLGMGRSPWIGWGPYLWTAGSEGRSDGLVWLPADVESDGTHPSDRGAGKVGDLLLDFFLTSPVTRCWFVAGLECS